MQSRFYSRTKVDQLLAARRALLLGVPMRQIVKDVGISEAAINTSVLVEDLPRVRCEHCRGLVIAPCLKCFVEGRISIKEDGENVGRD
jgi:hypothetical protein